jgi:hypothetical protein
LIGGAVRSLVQQQWVCVTNKKGLRGGTAPKPLLQQLLEGCLHHVRKRSLMTAQQRRPGVPLPRQMTRQQLRMAHKRVSHSVLCTGMVCAQPATACRHASSRQWGGCIIAGIFCRAAAAVQHHSSACMPWASTLLCGYHCDYTSRTPNIPYMKQSTTHCSCCAGSQQLHATVIVCKAVLQTCAAFL